jgi:iron(III) transport system ATP-binding protein
MTSVVLESVSRTFGKAPAVDRLDLRLEEGEFVTLLGPSGCGKTTTLRMIAGLEQNDTGRIHIGTRLVSDPASDLFVPPERRGLGMVFQSYAIWPHLTVFENVAYPLRVRRVPEAEVKAKVEAALTLVEMNAFAQRPAPHLSGGQQQRVAIARALVFEPQVLLLDEPLSNLDSRLRASMGDELRALQRRLKISSLYVTHDQNEAMALSDRVVVMKDGRILQQGSPEDIYRRPANVDVAKFLGTPNLRRVRVRSASRVDERTYACSVVGEDGWMGTCRSAEAWRPDEEATIVIRPESLQVDTQRLAPDATAWRGRVVDNIFRGAHRSVVVDCDGARMTVETTGTWHADVGAELTIAADPNHVWALRA